MALGKGNIRTFFAYALNDDIKDRISQLQQNILPNAEGIRKVDPEKFHITLKFIGPTDPHKLKIIAKEHRSEWEEMRSTRISIDKCGVFPSLGAAKVLWLGCSRDYIQLNQQFNVIDEALTKAFELKMEKGFHPHITMARIKRGLANPLKNKYISHDFESIDILLNRIICYESRRCEGKLIYEPLEVFELNVPEHSKGKNMNMVISSSSKSN